LPIRKIAAQLDIDPTLWERIEKDELPASKEVIAELREFSTDFTLRQ
jgi:hypothetical protein